MTSAEECRAQWYVASLVMNPTKGSKAEALREYWCLLTAENSELAYARSLALGTDIAARLSSSGQGGWASSGVSELLSVAEPPAPGSELVWIKTELPLADVSKLVRSREELTLAATSFGSGWYLGKLLLTEMHDTGSHGDVVLVWANWYLIQARDRKFGYRAAVELGTQQATEPGSHRCDGDTAHWAFTGIQDLIELMESPREGAVLWFDELTAPLIELPKLVPPKSKLGVFEWEEAQHRSG